MNDYIADLRKLVGNRPLLMCGASVILFNAQGQVLMLRRTDNDSWCFPGGAIELGEKAEEAAAREALEETGLAVDALELFGVFSGEELYYQYPNGDEVYNVDIVFCSHSYEGELQINHESRDVKFFSSNELPERISPPVAPIVKELKRRMLCIS